VEALEEEKNYEEIYECSECNMSFKDFEDHMKTFHENTQGEVEYEVLEEEEPDSDEEISMAFVIKNANGMFECSECFQTYKSLNRFLSHVKIHGTIVDENIKKLEDHLRKIDESRTSYEELQCEDDPAKKIYRCRVCQTEFDTRKKFLLHYPIHRNVSEAQKKNRKVVKASSQLFHCKLCNRTVSNEYEMKMHMNAHVENSTMGSRSTEPVAKKSRKKESQSMYPCQVRASAFFKPK
jgi:ribosomal protein L37AE/L43A